MGAILDCGAGAPIVQGSQAGARSIRVPFPPTNPK